MKRAYWWRLLIFDEDLKKDWETIIKELQLEVAYSHHDKDTWDKTVIEHDEIIHNVGDVKKPHWHFLIHYHTAKSFKQITDLIADLCLDGKAVKTAMVADYPRKAYEYLYHGNDPDKYQYGADIVQIQGCDPATFTDYIATTNKGSDTQLFKELLTFINEMGYLEMSDVVDCIMAHGRDDFLELLSGRSSYLLDSYLRSARLKAERDENYKYFLTARAVINTYFFPDVKSYVDFFARSPDYDSEIYLNLLNTRFGTIIRELLKSNEGWGVAK